MLLTTDMVSAPLVLALAYSGLVAYAALALATLRRHSTDVNLRAVFVASCFVSAALRVVSFTSLGLINLVVDTDDDGVARDSAYFAFLEKALLVLFDLPDFCHVSAYLLLLLKWTDVFLLSRKHWLSRAAYKRYFVGIFLVANTLLYTAQVCLYSLLFVPSINQNHLAFAIYYTLAVINLGVPLLWLIVFVVLTLQFAGFPFASSHASARYSSVSRVFEVWTCARIAWAVLSLSTALQGWLQIAPSRPIIKAVLLILVFLLLEIAPIVMAIRGLVHLAYKSEAAPSQADRLSSAAYHEGGTWEEVEEAELGATQYTPLLLRTPSAKEHLNSELYLRILEDVSSPVRLEGERHARSDNERHSPKRSFATEIRPLALKYDSV